MMSRLATIVAAGLAALWGASVAAQVTPPAPFAQFQTLTAQSLNNAFSTLAGRAFPTTGGTLTGGLNLTFQALQGTNGSNNYDAGQMFQMNNTNLDGDLRTVTLGTSPGGNGYVRSPHSGLDLVAGATLDASFNAGAINFNFTPTAPTPATGDNSNKLATTQFVQNQIVASGGGSAPSNAPLLGSSSAGSLQTVTVGSGLSLVSGVLQTSYAAVNRAGDAMSGNLYAPGFVENGGAGSNRFTTLQTSNSTRWSFGANSSSESGGNAGSDLGFYRYSDNGTYLDQPFFIARGTGQVSAYDGMAVSAAPGFNALQVVQGAGTNQDLSALDVRRTVNQSGGSFGYVNNAIRAYTTVYGTSSNFEWAFTGRVDNYSTGNNNEVGGYLQGRCEVAGCSATWGGTSEAVDFSGQSNAPHGLIGHEFDVEADGPDNPSNRVIIDAYCKQHDSSSTFAVCGNGLRVSSQGNAEFNNAALIQGNFYTGLQINGNGGTYDVFGLRLLGSYSGPAIDTSSASLSTDAIKLAQGQYIALEGTDTYTLSQNPSNGTNYTNVSVAAFGLRSSERVGLRMDSGEAGLRLGGLNVFGQGGDYALQYTGSGFQTNQPLNINAALSAGGTPGVSCAAGSTVTTNDGIVTGCGTPSGSYVSKSGDTMTGTLNGPTFNATSNYQLNGANVIGTGAYSALQYNGSTLTVNAGINFANTSGAPIQVNGTTAVNCAAGTVNLSTLTITNGLVTHC